MIWFRHYTLEEVNEIFARNMTGYLDIKASKIEDRAIYAVMPVTDKVKQPYGILHGGASVVLAESVGSIASNMIVDDSKYMGVGLDVNANHLRPASKGTLTAACVPLHIGKTTHVWEIKIRDEREHLICISRLTVAIVPKR